MDFYRSHTQVMRALMIPTGCHVATDKAKANHPFAVEGWLWLLTVRGNQ
jgi:hypothetical protein